MSAGGVDPGWRIALGAVAWLAGIALQLQQAALWPASRYALGCAVALALAAALVLARRRGRPAAAIGALLLACALAGGATTGLRAQLRMADALDPALEGVELRLTGVIASLPQAAASGTRFVFEVESAWRGGEAVTVPGQVPSRIALGWYRHDGDEPGLDLPAAEMRAGQRWSLPVRLRRPHGTMNPHGFDVELWWWEQGLRATGSVRQARGSAGAELLDRSAAHPVERARQHLRDAIYAQVSDPRVAGVLAALVVGDQSAIEREDWDLFRNTGIAHLMSISGLHVTMFAWLAGAAVGWAWRRSPGLMLRLPAPMAGRWGGLAVACGYALIAGWGVPAQRTLLMLGCAVALRSAGLRWPWPLVLAAAAVTVTLLDPWALLQPGFWLSFAAVGMLLASQARELEGAATGWRVRAGGWWRDHLRSQWVATLGLAPLSLVFFQQISLVGFVANLVAIPLVTLAITPLAILGALFAPLWTLAGWGIDALMRGLGIMAAWPLAVWTVAAAPGWAVAGALGGALLAVLPLPWRLRAVALPLMLPLLLPPPNRPAHGAFDLVVADVGQGSAVLLRTRSHLLLYDTGPRYSIDSDAGRRVLAPLLRARGETAVDLLVLSHRDSDHVGGADSLRAALPVRQITSSIDPADPLVAGAAHRRCDDGQRWEWDGVRFELLYPAPDDHVAGRKPNALSCVLRAVDAQGRSVLLTGDIEAPQEAVLLQRHGAELASTWLLVPHHGSRTSSSAAFIDAVRPRVALVQAGYRSRYGHPAAEVVERYRARGIALQRSDHCGAWVWQRDAARCTRDERRRYWHWTAPPPEDTGPSGATDAARR